MKFIRFLKCDFLDVFGKYRIFYWLSQFLLPLFGILVAYFTYHYNHLANFHLIFPKLLIWITFSRNYFLGANSLIGRSNFLTNQSMKMLGFNRYHLITAVFIRYTFYYSLPPAIFYFCFFNLVFGLHYSLAEIFSFIVLLIFSCCVLYAFGVATKAFQTRRPNLLLAAASYFLIVFTSSPFIDVHQFDPHQLWYHYLALLNPLASLNLLSYFVFTKTAIVTTFYLPLTACFAYLFVSFGFFRYIYWLKK